MQAFAPRHHSFLINVTKQFLLKTGLPPIESQPTKKVTKNDFCDFLHHFKSQEDSQASTEKTGSQSAEDSENCTSIAK